MGSLCRGVCELPPGAGVVGVVVGVVGGSVVVVGGSVDVVVGGVPM